MSGRVQALAWLGEASAAGARIGAACAVLGVTPRTVQRWRKSLHADGRKSNRFAKSNALTRAERKRLIEVACSPEFRDLSPNQIVPILAERGVYIASESTFYRVLKAAGLLKHRSRARAPERQRPAEFVATEPNQVWTWDISLLLHTIRGSYFYLYMIIDIWDRSVVAWRVEKDQGGEFARDLLDEACIREGVIPGRLVIHQDNGGPMVSEEYLSAVATWGTPSYSRPGVSDDNPYSESLFRTTKYRPDYPIRFESIEQAREWVASFVLWYNNDHRHSAIAFVTPAQRRCGADKQILATRKDTYAKAQRANPLRWSGKTRAWESPKAVFLNPRQKKNRQKRAA